MKIDWWKVAIIVSIVMNFNNVRLIDDIRWGHDTVTPLVNAKLLCESMKVPDVPVCVAQMKVMAELKK